MPQNFYHRNSVLKLNQQLATSWRLLRAPKTHFGAEFHGSGELDHLAHGIYSPPRQVRTRSCVDNPGTW